MIITIKNLQEQIEQFNAGKKYICNCSYCGNNFIYTKDEINGKNSIDFTIKCPYCSHIEYYNRHIDVEWNKKIILKDIVEFNDEDFNV